MKKIVIIGSSPAAVSFIETFRAHDKESQITFLSNEGQLPYDATALLDFAQGKIKLDKLFVRGKDFYEKNNVSCQLTKKITRINFKRKRIFTEDKDKEQIEYDNLFIADSLGYRFPEIKGNNKTGLYDIYSLTSLKTMVGYLPVTDTFVFQDDSLWGLKLALAFRSRGKEVYYIAEENGLWSNLLTHTSNQWLLEALNAKGMQVILKNSIAEILGEGEAKAIRLKSGKVLACEIIALGQSMLELKPFNDSDLAMKEKIVVDQNFRTNFEDVYVVGALSQTHTDNVPYAGIGEFEGKIVAEQMLGQNNGQAQIPIFEQDLIDENFVIQQLGAITAKNLFLQAFDAANMDKKSYVKLWVESNILSAGIFVNSRDKKDLAFAAMGQKNLFSEVQKQFFTEEATGQPLAQSEHLIASAENSGQNQT